MKNSSNVDNSATVDDRSTRKDYSHNINYGRKTSNVTSHEVGNQTSPESTAQMSIDPQHRGMLAEQIKSINDNDPVNLSAAETKFVKDNAAYLKDIVSMTNTDVEAIRQNLNAGAGVKVEGGVHTGRTLPGMVAGFLFGVNANVTGNAHGGYEHNWQAADTDAKQANLNFTPVAKLYNLTGRMAEREIREDINENHRHLDVKEREEMLEDRKYDLWAEKFQGGMSTLLEDAIARNKEQFDNTGKDKEEIESLIEKHTK